MHAESTFHSECMSRKPRSLRSSAGSTAMGTSASCESAPHPWYGAGFFWGKNIYYIYISLSLYLSLYLSIYLPIHPSIYLSVYLSIYTRLFMYQSIYLSNLIQSNLIQSNLSIYLSISLSLCLSVCRSIYIFIDHPKDDFKKSLKGWQNHVKRWFSLPFVRVPEGRRFPWWMVPTSRSSSVTWHVSRLGYHQYNRTNHWFKYGEYWMNQMNSDDLKPPRSPNLERFAARITMALWDNLTPWGEPRPDNGNHSHHLGGWRHGVVTDEKAHPKKIITLW